MSSSLYEPEQQYNTRPRLQIKDPRVEAVKLGIKIAGLSTAAILTLIAIKKLVDFFQGEEPELTGKIASDLKETEDNLKGAGDEITGGITSGQETSKAIIEQDWLKAFTSNTTTVNKLYNAQKKIQEGLISNSNAKERAAYDAYEKWKSKEEQQKNANVGLWFTIIGGVAGQVALTNIRKEKDAALVVYNSTKRTEASNRKKYTREIGRIEAEQSSWNSQQGALYNTVRDSYINLRTSGKTKSEADKAIKNTLKKV